MTRLVDVSVVQVAQKTDSEVCAFCILTLDREYDMLIIMKGGRRYFSIVVLTFQTNLVN